VAFEVFSVERFHVKRLSALSSGLNFPSIHEAAFAFSCPESPPLHLLLLFPQGDVELKQILLFTHTTYFAVEQLEKGNHNLCK
jgi:hypothetical protein